MLKCTQHSAVSRLGVFIYGGGGKVLKVYKNFLCDKIYAQNNFTLTFQGPCIWHSSKERHSLTVFPSWHCALFQNLHRNNHAFTC
jgi:hypothetical protein